MKTNNNPKHKQKYHAHHILAGSKCNNNALSQDSQRNESKK